jgi:uncharacterized protein (TIGR02147 family)
MFILNIYQYKDYKKILTKFIADNKNIRGYQSKLADACQCHSSFIYQVINTHLHLTPDQGADLSLFWQLDEEASEYFLNLIYLARSASKNYQKIIQDKLNSIRKKRFDISKKISNQQLSLEKQVVYYAQWYMIAIQLLIGMTSFNDAQKIAERLGLNEQLVNESIKKLEDVKIIEKRKDGSWETLYNLHLDKSSPLATIYQTHWRQYALRKLQEKNSEDMYYSCVYTADAETFEKIKEKIMTIIRESADLMDQSSEKDIFCLIFDNYRL